MLHVSSSACLPTFQCTSVTVAFLRHTSRHICASRCRCGPFPPALKALQDARVKRLVASMVSAEFPISQGVEAIEQAKTKGILKVVITMDG